MKNLIILFILLITLSSFFWKEKEEPAKSILCKRCDSATFILKNVSKHELKRIRAIIKGKNVEFFNIKPNSETPAFKVCLGWIDHYRFAVYKDNLEDKETIEPSQYYAQISKEKIEQGTYVYYIGYDKEDVLEISLKKIKP